MGPEPEQEFDAAVEYVTSARFCGGCGHPTSTSGTDVRVVDISQVKTGWLARGVMHNRFCAQCGQAYERLVQYIPIECASFPCPGCGASSRLTAEILSITREDMGYSFAALLKCPACSKKRRFAKLLGGLSKITKIKVGPAGVEVEVKP
jgi:hypothetical protein